MRRDTEILPYTVKTAVGFLDGHRARQTKVRMVDGKLQAYWASGHRTRSGVKYNRLLRLRRRVLK